MPEITRIAMLLRSLDDQAADAVLSRLPNDVRASVEKAMEPIVEVPAPECEQIARDFLGGMRRAVQNRNAEHAAPLLPSFAAADLDTASFESLVEYASITALAELVQHEHPQICAVMMARLSPQRAAELLQAIVPETRADVLRRVLELDEADSAAVGQIREALATSLREQLRQQRRDSERLQRVQAILGAANPDVRNDLLEVVERNAAACSARHNSPHCSSGDSQNHKYEDAVQTSVSFDRLVDCEQDILRELFRALPFDVAAVALSGASQPVRSYILERLPQPTTTALSDRLSNLGPVRVADIHLAQAIVLRMLERSMTSVPPANHRITLSA